MSPGILGKKIGMTQVFRPDGQVVPVTLLKAAQTARERTERVWIRMSVFLVPKRKKKRHEPPSLIRAGFVTSLSGWQTRRCAVRDGS